MPPSSVRSRSRSDWRQISPRSAAGSPHPGGSSTRMPGRRRPTASASEAFVYARGMNRGACIHPAPLERPAESGAARARARAGAAAGAGGGRGGRALALEFDVGDGESIARAVAATEAALGPVDVLVNNAGIAESAPLLATAPQVWDRHVRINATGPFLVTRA